MPNGSQAHSYKVQTLRVPLADRAPSLEGEFSDGDIALDPLDSGAAFRRYGIASPDEKAEALRKAREYAKTRAAVGKNVSAFPDRTDNATDTRPEVPAIFLGNLVAVEGFEPPTQRI
jgi:hypothetical protein